MTKRLFLSHSEQSIIARLLAEKGSGLYSCKMVSHRIWIRIICIGTVASIKELSAIICYKYDSSCHPFPKTLSLLGCCAMFFFLSLMNTCIPWICVWCSLLPMNWWRYRYLFPNLFFLNIFTYSTIRERLYIGLKTKCVVLNSLLRLSPNAS